MIKSDFDFIPSGLKCSFDAGPQWKILTDAAPIYDTAFSSFMHKLIARPECSVAFASFSAFFRGDPLDGVAVAKVRLYSYFYNSANAPVYDRTWPEIVNTPNYLAASGAIVTTKVNVAMKPTPPNFFDNWVHIGVQVWGKGDLFTARLEMLG